MRIVEVVGTVTLNRVHPSLAGFRWVIGVPFSLRALRDPGPPDGEDVVMLDPWGAAIGDRLGVSEGVEAAMPFWPEKKPVDAYGACLLDQLIIHKQS